MSLPNVLEKGKRIYTKSLVPGTKHFQESILKLQNDEYREVSIRQSKLFAAYAKGCKQFGITEGCSILYLGASHGYTPSFLSDVIGKKGTLFCVEFSPSVTRDLVFVCEQRENMIPILADATRPQEYAERVTSCDVVFQDIAQQKQVQIFLDNCKLFLEPKGYGLLSLKARSVDTTKDPKTIFRQIKGQLNNTPGFTLMYNVDLYPFEKDHMFFVVRRD